MSERTEQFKRLIAGGQIDSAIELVKGTGGHENVEQLVAAALEAEHVPSALLEAALGSFLQTREYSAPEHGYWVHSLSHFTKLLWARRMDAYIKRFNQAAFKGAKELSDPNCSDRLVEDFAKYAQFSDDPIDFHLRMENLKWVNWEHHEYAKARIEAGRFDSEAAFLRWQLGRPEKQIALDAAVQLDMVDVNGIRSLIQRLQELGVDVGEFRDLERTLLTKQLSDFEEELHVTRFDWMKKRLEKGISKTRTLLGQSHIPTSE